MGGPTEFCNEVDNILIAISDRNGGFHLKLFQIILQFIYSELSNKHEANFILFEKIFPPTCLIRAYTFIYFWGKFLPTRLLEPPRLGENHNYYIILSSFKV